MILDVLMIIITGFIYLLCLGFFALVIWGLFQKENDIY